MSKFLQKKSLQFQVLFTVKTSTLAVVTIATVTGVINSLSCTCTTGSNLIGKLLYIQYAATMTMQFTNMSISSV